MVGRPIPAGGANPPTKKLPGGPAYDLARDVLPLARLAQLGKKRAVREVENRLGVGEREAEGFILKLLTS
jgi:hypothetical protein